MLERQRNCRGAGCAPWGAGVRERLWHRSLLIVLAATAGSWVARAEAQRMEHAAVGSVAPMLAQDGAAFWSAVPAAGPANAVPERAAATALRLENRHKLMIFGTAVFFTGAIIGDDAGTVIMIGGAATALYGLYRTLWPPDEESSPGGGRQLHGCALWDGQCGTEGARGAGCATASRHELSAQEPLSQRAARHTQPCPHCPPARPPVRLVLRPAPVACNSAGRESS